MGSHVALLCLALLAAPAGCAPELPPATEYRVSLREALRTGAAGGLDEGLEEEPVAFLGPDVITLGELVHALTSLPPNARYYYTSADRALAFLQNHVVMNLCAREAVKGGLDHDPAPRMELLAALERQIRGDLLADRVRLDGADAARLEEARERTWREHIAALRQEAEITVDRERLRALSAASK
ncbi:MAG: hypothetical protein FJ098_15785 [Deltaproteobacteria bacterium]|nr:hypothetical protein [Deltaproteobacteria bacterium]